MEVVTVNPAPALACAGATMGTPENTALTVSAACTNRAGALTLSTASGGAPGHGALTFDNSKDTISYTPTTGFTGSDQFTYQASDGTNTSTAIVTVTVGSVVCSSSFEQTTTGQPITIGLACTGPAGVPLSTSIASGHGPSHGTLSTTLTASSNGFGQIEYTPAAGFAGTDSFEFSATGGGITSALATMTITVGAPIPTCSDVTVSTPPGTSISVPLQCGGPLGTTLTLASTTQPGSGLLGSVDQTTRTVTYTPNSNFVGSDSFSYHASGGGQTSLAATVFVTVGPTCGDAFNGAVIENQPAEIALNCFGARGQVLTLSTMSSPLHGALGQIDSDHQLVLYTPAADYVGPDAFTYKATQAGVDSNVATASIAVQAPGSSAASSTPACQAQSVSTVAATAAVIPLTCTDPNGSTLTLSIITNPSHGTLGAIDTVHDQVTYTPDAGYAGSDRFTFEASDGSATATGFVRIDVGASCFDASSSGATAAQQHLQLSCTVSGTPTYQIASSPSHGSLSGLNTSTGAVTYTPNSGYDGGDAFTYDVMSGGQTSYVAVYTISVADTLPQCSNVSVSTAKNTAVSVPLSCTGASGATLTLSVPNGSEPQNGTLGTIDQVHSTVLYTPTSGFQGSDSFTYGASDGNQSSIGATVTVTVGLSCQDTDATATEDQLATVQLTCQAPIGTTLTIGSVNAPSHGTLGTIDSTAQTIQYTPDTGFTGTDSFTIDATSGSGTSSSAVVTVDVQPAPPSCHDVGAVTAVNQAVNVPLHCISPGGATLTLFVPGGDGPSNGNLGAINQSNQTVQYTPATNFQGVDSFTYEASDGNQLGSAQATITVSNGPSCADVSSVTTNENTAVSVPLSCANPGGGTMTLSTVTGPLHGALGTYNSAAQTVQYTPTTGYSGADSFTYHATAGAQTSNTATVSIAVVPPPACSDVNGVSTNENVGVTVQLVCTDSQGRTMTLGTVAAPSHGSLGSYNSAAQTVQYNPTAGYSGADSFTYQATAGGQTSNAATVSITVVQAPACRDATAATDVNAAITIPLRCTDSLGRTLTLSTSGSGPSHGALGAYNSSAQTVQYTPNSGYTGGDSFSYMATSTPGSQQSNAATVTITVNPDPTCSAESPAAISAATTIQLACSGGTGSLTLSTSGSGPSHGMLGAYNSSAQTVQYTPTTGYAGSDSFAYRATDSLSVASAAATVTITDTTPPPSCQAASAATDEATAVTVQLHCTDSLGRTLTLSTSGGGPSHGALGAYNSSAQTVQYTPNAGYTGSDSFGYIATGSGQPSSPATVAITVNAPPSCSVETPASISAATTVQLACTGGTGSLTLSTSGSGPSHGTLGSYDSAAQTVRYTPTTGYAGPDSFAYHATDSQNVTSAAATVTITDTTAPPSCQNASANADAGTAVSVQLHCSDSLGRTLTLSTSGSGPGHGTLGAYNSTAQTVQYTASTGFSGSDSFSYIASAGGQPSTPATVTITVNAAPACSAASATTAAGTPTAIHLACSGGTGTLTIAAVSAPAHGTLGSYNAATGTITYTPAAGFIGSDSFTYGATDALGVSSGAATVMITVPAPSPPPPLPPTCTVRLTGSTVLLKAHKTGPLKKEKPGSLALTVECDQAAAVTIKGTVTITGKKPKHGKAPTQTVTLPAIHVTVNAGVATTVTVSLPHSVLAELAAKRAESVKFTATGTDANGTSAAASASATLHGRT
jgi:hypothetical protein